MPETPLGVGIDFGTSNSAVAIAYRDRVEVVRAEPAQPVLPSIVYLHRDGDRRAGRQAVERFFVDGHVRTSCGNCALAPYGVSECRQFRRDGGCNDARLLSGLKHDLAKPGFTGTNSWCTDFTVAELVEVVIRRLKRAADEHAQTPITSAVLGHPVVFAGETGPADHQEALDRLAAAARRAGFEDVSFLPEPAAALRLAAHDPDRLPALAVDFGGGTFDAAVLDTRGETVAMSGVAVGGERLDQVLFESRVGPELGLERLPNWLYNEMRSLSGVRILMSDPGLPHMLARYGGDAAALTAKILYEGHALAFYRAIEAAKIQLSMEDHARVTFRPLGVDVPVGRRHFETSIRPELDRIDHAIERALAQAGLEAADVRAVVATGGSSLVPAFQARIRARFPTARLDYRDAFTSVVEGLAASLRTQPSRTRA